MPNDEVLAKALALAPKVMAILDSAAEEVGERAWEAGYRWAESADMKDLEDVAELCALLTNRPIQRLGESTQPPSGLPVRGPVLDERGDLAWVEFHDVFTLGFLLGAREIWDQRNDDAAG